MGRMTIPYYWKIDERQCNWTRHIWFHLPGLQKMNEMKAMENLWFQCSIYRSLLEGNLYSKHFVVIHPSSMKFSWVAEVSKRQEPSFLGLPAVVIAMCWKCWKKPSVFGASISTLGWIWSAGALKRLPSWCDCGCYLLVSCCCYRMLLLYGVVVVIAWWLLLLLLLLLLLWLRALLSILRSSSNSRVFELRSTFRRAARGAGSKSLSPQRLTHHWPLVACSPSQPLCCPFWRSIAPPQRKCQRMSEWYWQEISKCQPSLMC